jgi:hypothetical protein
MKTPDLFYKIAGIVHRKNPDSLVVKIDAEFRDDRQLDKYYSEKYGVDLTRYMLIQTNRPKTVLSELKDVDLLKLIGVERRLGIEIVKGVEIE